MRSTSVYEHLRAAIAAFGLLLCLQPMATAQVAQEAPVEQPVNVQADDIRFFPETQKFSAEGNVVVVHGDTSLRAGKITGDPEAGDLEASGDVRFSSPERSLTGDSFVYNYRTDRGTALQAAAKIDSIYFRGKELTAEPGKYSMKDTRFTACDAENPHYYLTAKQLVIMPNREIIAKDVSFVILGKRLFTISSYRFNLDPNRDRTMAVPILGYSSAYGIFALYEVPLATGDGNEGKAELRLSTKRALTGGVRFDRYNDQPFFARLTYHEPTDSVIHADTLVSRAPEVGYRYYSDPKQRTRPVPRTPLELSRGYFNPGQVLAPGRADLVAEASVGEFIEDPRGTSSARGDVRALVYLENIASKSGIVVSPAVMGRFSAYSSGDTFTAAGARLAVGKRFADRTFASVAYMTYATAGDTPFQFDDIELRDELAGSFSLALSDYTLGYTLRYDLRQDRVFDEVYSVARILHCIEPQIYYRKATSEIGFRLDLVGL